MFFVSVLCGLVVLFFTLLVVVYLGYVTVSAKIRRGLYERLRRYGIVVSDVIRRTLEEEEVRGALMRAQKILKKIPSEELVSAIRAGREER